MPGGVKRARHRTGQRAAGGTGRRTSVAVVVRWAAAGLFACASFWICLGASELTGGRPWLSPWQDVPAAHNSGCTALALHRHDGRTTAAPCPDTTPMHDMLTARLFAPVQN